EDALVVLDAKAGDVHSSESWSVRSPALARFAACRGVEVAVDVCWDFGGVTAHSFQFRPDAQIRPTVPQNTLTLFAQGSRLRRAGALRCAQGRLSAHGSHLNSTVPSLLEI